MKQYFLFLVFLVFTFNINAQKKDGDFFSKDKDKFIGQLKDFFGQTARDDLKDAASKFSVDVKSGKVTTEQLTAVIDLFNLFHDRRVPTYPYYLNYLQTIDQFNKAGVIPIDFATWSSQVYKMVQEQSRGNNKDYANYINFLHDLFEKNALHSDKAKTWYLKDKTYLLKEEEGKPVLIVDFTYLIGYTREDTLTIYNTAGKYYPMTHVWYGKKGRCTWERAGISIHEGYADFQAYKIDFNDISFNIDTAMLTFYEFFKEPIFGRYMDKLIPENRAERTVYPKFLSFRKDFHLKGVISDNIVYKGDFNLIGPKVFARATDTSEVMIEFLLKDKVTKALTARGTEITVLKGKRVSIDNAQTVLYYSKDTILHPSLSVQYNLNKNELRLIRGESGLDRSRFYTTFHKMEFEADLVRWNLNEDSITFKMLSGAGKSASVFISEDNFDKTTYNTARGAAFYDPLTLMRQAVDELGTKEIPLYYLCKKFDKSLTEEQTLSLIYLLIENGFVFYEPNKKIVTIREKVISYYLLANSKRVDYDILKIKSFGKEKTASLNLKNFNLSLTDCRMIPFNDSTEVYAYPKQDSLVIIGKNRDMKFDAKILCGRMDMYGDNFQFKYDSFTFTANKLDTMRINIPDGDKIDVDGKEVLRPILSKIENIKGVIEINKPNNKSGRVPYFMYPRLKTTAPCFVYYDMPENNGGIYKRDKFFFEIKPFEQDSLLKFDPRNLFYDGKLITAKIFPDIPQRLMIQEDFSLGFKHLTPIDGLPLYQGRGNFTGDITLNNKGLNGNGDIVFQTTTIKTDSVIFFPEQALTTSRELTMKEQKGKDQVEFPEVTSSKNKIDWRPYADSMTIVSQDSIPFSMYRGITKMNGLLTLTSKGLSGAGSLDWSEASVSSNLMKFKVNIMTADTAALQIKTLDGDKVTFKTPNVKAKIDFIERMGAFKSNTADISTDFAYNQYRAYLNEFKWDIDKKILDFSAPPGSDGAVFQSIHPNQDSLVFKAMRGRYNLITSIIKCEGVHEIRVADSKVVPEKELVEIYPEAKIQTLKNAKLIGDTSHNWHIIENASIDIYGKNDLVGFGEVNLKINGKDQFIKFSSIKVNTAEEKGPKKTIIKKHTIQADGNVPAEQKLQIYPNTFYYGDVVLNSEKQLLNFKGSARLKFNNPPRITDWFLIENDINTNQLYFFKDSVFTEELLPLYTGINLDKVSLTGLYTSILEGKQNPTDLVLLDAKGVIMHDKNKNRYYFGDSAKLKGNSLKGNIIEYNDTGATVRGEGKIDFNFNLGGLPIKTSGYIINELLKKHYDFYVTMGLRFMIDKSPMNLITNTLLQETMDNKDLTYEGEDSKKQLSELLDKKDFDKYMADASLTGAMQTMPKRFNYNLIFTQLNLEFNEQDMAYRSKGDFGLIAMGGKLVNKKVSGYVEFGHRGLSDFFNIYIKTPTKEWVYFGFKNNMLSIVTSLEDINGAIGAIDEKKRLIKKNDLEYYMYTLGLESDAKDFIKRMQNGGAFEENFKGEISGDSVLIDPELLHSTPSLDSIEGAEGTGEEGEPVLKMQPMDSTGTITDSTGTSLSTNPEVGEEDRKKSKKKKKKKGKEEVPAEGGEQAPASPSTEEGSGVPTEQPAPPSEEMNEKEKAKQEAETAKKAAAEEAKRLKEEQKAREKAEKEAAKKAKEHQSQEGQVPTETPPSNEGGAPAENAPEQPQNDEAQKAKEEAEAAKKAAAEEARKQKEEAEAAKKAAAEEAKRLKEEAEAAKKAAAEEERKQEEEAEAAKKAAAEEEKRLKEEQKAKEKAEKEAEKLKEKEAKEAEKNQAPTEPQNQEGAPPPESPGEPK